MPVRLRLITENRFGEKRQRRSTYITSRSPSIKRRRNCKSSPSPLRDRARGSFFHYPALEHKAPRPPDRTAATHWTTLPSVLHSPRGILGAGPGSPTGLQILRTLFKIHAPIKPRLRVPACLEGGGHFPGQ